MKFLQFALIVSTLIIATTTHAEIIEKWECQELYGNWSKILVVTTINEGRKTGTIEVAGIKHKAIFEISGFKRRWDFENYKYTFTINPNGDGSYYDFSQSAKTAAPSMIFSCRSSLL